MVGIIGAMEVEVESLKKQMQDCKVIRIAGMDFFKGTLEGKDCVVAKCGVGKVNSALCVQIMADHFKPDCVINTGVAGSLCNDINIGDIVLSTDVVEHDMDCTPIGYEPGRIPGTEALSFKADESMRKNVYEYLQKNFGNEIQIFEGRIVSGDQFIADNSKKEWLISTFGGKCAEMEGASIGHAASLNRIPFLILRAISDKADGSAQMDFPSFEAKAAERMARIIQSLVKDGIF